MWCNKTGFKGSAIDLPEDCPLPDIASPTDMEKLSDKLDDETGKIVLEYMIRLAYDKFSQDPYELYEMLEGSGELNFISLQETKKIVNKVAMELEIL